MGRRLIFPALMLCGFLLGSEAFGRGLFQGLFNSSRTEKRSPRFSCSRCGKPLVRCRRCGRLHHSDKTNADPLAMNGSLGNGLSRQPNAFLPNQDPFETGFPGSGFPTNENFSSGSGGNRMNTHGPAGRSGFGRALASTPRSPQGDLGRIDLPRSGLLDGSGVIKNAASQNSSGLVPANTKGNPGWQFEILMGKATGLCQATLIGASNGVCRAATAAHCLVDSRLPALRRATLEGQEAMVGEATIRSADFGEVKVTRYINPEFIQNNRLDSAVMAWPCPDGAGQVKVVPVGKSQLSPNESVVYGKVMAGLQGLYRARIFRDPTVTSINYLPVGEGQETARQEGPSIQQGDSGGPLLRRFVDGFFELVGVLSAKEDQTGDSHYSTNRAIDFIDHVSESVGGTNAALYAGN